MNRFRSGQTVVEYVLLMGIMILMTTLLVRYLPPTFARLEKLVKDKYLASYRYGDPLTKGWDEGGPTLHPRAYEPGGRNFRIFRRTKQ